MEQHQLFTMDLANTEPETIEAAKKQMYLCATELGFCGYHDEFKVQHYNDPITGAQLYRLNCTFYLQPPGLILP